MLDTGEKFFKKDVWSTENRRYIEPHFRLQKCSKIINALARGKNCDLLDVGCGPAALEQLLDNNIRYYGVDIALQHSAPNLYEVDFVENEIALNGMMFDMIVASGFFEYMGDAQNQKFSEIQRILKKDGTFIVSYINFSHVHRIVVPLYNNVRTIQDFRTHLERFFHVKRSFPVSYNWQGTPPKRPLLKRLEMNFNVNIPLIARFLAVEYFFICSPKGSI